MRQLTVLVVLALAACSQDPPATATDEPAAGAPVVRSTPGALAAAPPPPVSMDLSQPLLARGNEPFWAVRIEGAELTLARPEAPEKLFTAPGAQVTSGRARWTGTASDGQTLTVTLYISECNDGMSDLRYSMAAEVLVLGETLSGCAGKAADLARAVR